MHTSHLLQGNFNTEYLFSFPNSHPNSPSRQQGLGYPHGKCQPLKSPGSAGKNTRNNSFEHCHPGTSAGFQGWDQQFLGSAATCRVVSRTISPGDEAVLGPGHPPQRSSPCAPSSRRGPGCGTAGCSSCRRGSRTNPGSRLPPQIPTLGRWKLSGGFSELCIPRKNLVFSLVLKFGCSYKIRFPRGQILFVLNDFINLRGFKRFWGNKAGTFHFWKCVKASCKLFSEPGGAVTGCVVAVGLFSLFVCKLVGFSWQARGQEQQQPGSSTRANWKKAPESFPGAPRR